MEAPEVTRSKATTAVLATERTPLWRTGRQVTLRHPPYHITMY